MSGALPLVGHTTQFLRDQLRLLERGYREYGEIFRLRLGRRPAGFGGGTHRCLGEHFADLLTHVSVTRLLQHYELTLVSRRPAPVRTPAFKGPRSPCLIRHRARSSWHAVLHDPKQLFHR